MKWTLGQQNRINFVMVDAANTEVAGLGAGYVLQISKNGAAFAASAGTKTEIGSGWYSYLSTAAEADTVGGVAIRVTGAGCIQQNLAYPVEADTLTADVTAALYTFSPVRDALVSSDLTLYRGDTWLQPISRLGDLTGYTAIWITARADKANTDAQSAFQVLLSAPPVATDGLQVINSALATTPGNASITIDNLTTGNITVRIEAVETAKLAATDTLYYDIQWTDGTDVETRRRGKLCCISDVTRAVS